MYRAVLLLLCAGSCFAVQPSEEAVKKELKLFQGKWDATGGQGFDGTVPTDIELQLTSLEVDGDKFTMKTGSLTIKGSFTVDPTKKPKTIDVFFGVGPRCEASTRSRTTRASRASPSRARLGPGISQGKGLHDCTLSRQIGASNYCKSRNVLTYCIRQIRIFLIRRDE